MTTYAEYYGIVLPAEADVEDGVQFGWDGDEFTGTLVVGGGGGAYTSAANVRYNTDRGDGVLGTLRVPAAGEVLAGVLIDATSGTVVLPGVSRVVSGVAFGASSELVGTFVYPLESDVRIGTDYGASEEFTGTLETTGVSVPSGGSMFQSMAGTAKSAHTHFFATSVTLAESGTAARSVTAVLYHARTETRVDEHGNQNRVTVRDCRFTDLTTVRHDATVTIGTEIWTIDEVITREASGLYVRLKKITQHQTSRSNYRGRG